MIRFSTLHLAFATCLFLPRIATAQDTLYLQTGKSLVVHVDEIGLEEVKYHVPGQEVVRVIDREEVRRIGLHDGTAIAVPHDPMSVAYDPRLLAKKNAVKMEVLSLALDHLTFGYERVIKPWMNVEGRMSVIGVGNAKLGDRGHGVMFAAGIKFISRPEQFQRGMRLGHPLAGRYVKPEILINSFTAGYVYDGWFNTGGNSTRYTNVALNVILGKQRFLGDGITFDTWIGIGYGFQTTDQGSGFADRTWCYNHLLLGNSLPIALSAGMSLGVAF
ncbi:MAG TPA: hypothetical protein VHL57_08220 [Flavobacteriales bacterium]|nr:hypothetical protein [Flavobacteriales bacterium]